MKTTSCKDRTPPRPLMHGWETVLVRRLLIAVLVSSGLLTLAPGCATYQFGSRSLYRSDLRTVHVPIFQSESLRPNLGERLTEAVVREIERRTPYKVVSDFNADSVLNGRIFSETKRTIAEDINDVPRIIETSMMVEFQWIDRRGGVMLNSSQSPLTPVVLALEATDVVVPEAGQSIATSQQRAISKAAAQIVDQMEFRW